jgi:hypothetical protein
VSQTSAGKEKVNSVITPITQNAAALVKRQKTVFQSNGRCEALQRTVNWLF